ncbi:MAG: hypothetical protein ABFS56_14935 [Pseudomonadota bacterium]
MDVILRRIAKGLSNNTIIRNNTAIRQAFKNLLQSRKPENFPSKPSALVKKEISFTESLRYLTLPVNNQPRIREMKRDIDRKVLGVLFTPKDNKIDDMNVADSFKNPSVLFRTIRKLYEEDCCNVIVVYYGVRLPPKQPKQPMFIPHDPNYDVRIP